VSYLPRQFLEFSRVRFSFLAQISPTPHDAFDVGIVPHRLEVNSRTDLTVEQAAFFVVRKRTQARFMGRRI
jgi:hypothetical protein